MTSLGFFTLRFYGPLMLAVVTLVLTLVVKVRDPEQSVRFFHVPDGYFRINIPLGIEIPLSLRYVWVIRTALLLGTVLWLATSLGTDFSSYFPSKLRMNVFYDEPGIEAALSEFTESEKTALSIASDWQARRREYYVRLKKPLARLWSALNPAYARDTAYLSPEAVSATGETSFIVERVGTLAYRITESSGRLEHTIESPNVETKTFLTFFELRQTEYNHIRPSFLRLLTDPTYILRPEFKQILSLDPRRGRAAAFDHVLIGLTKIRLLPFPNFGNTIYLWKMPNVGAVPVGYAVYY